MKRFATVVICAATSFFFQVVTPNGQTVLTEQYATQKECVEVANAETSLLIAEGIPDHVTACAPYPPGNTIFN